RASGPFVQILDHIAFDDARRGPAPILRNQGQHRFEPFEQLVGVMARQVGMNHKMLRLVVGNSRLVARIARRRRRGAQVGADAQCEKENASGILTKTSSKNERHLLYYTVPGSSTCRS